MTSENGALETNTSFNDLAVKLREHSQHSMLSYLSFLRIAVLHSLDTEADILYDRNHQMYDAALLTRSYTQHALRPFIDFESNHIRHFIKIPFIYTGIDFIDLQSIFQNKSETQSIPTYFQNSEPPIICYKYNKPFNINKLVSILIFMLILRSLEIVKIQIIFINPPDIYLLEIKNNFRFKNS